jgi:hypothetical protein
MKMNKVALLIFVLACQSSLAETARLFLVPRETTIKPRQRVTLEIYLYNASSQTITAPSLEHVTSTFWSRKLSDRTSDGSFTLHHETSTHPPPPQSLSPNSIQHKTIDFETDAQPGDLLEVSVEIGEKFKLRSNSVLLFCPIEATKKN